MNSHLPFHRSATRPGSTLTLAKSKTPHCTMNTRSSLAALGRHLLPLLLLLGLALVQAQAQPTPRPPGQTSYQGFLQDANGTPLATNAPKNYDVIFRIYNAPTAGTVLWSELQTVTVDRGYFSVLLGQGSAVPGAPYTNDLSSIFVGPDASDRYIGMTVRGLTGGDLEIQPRLRLLASPYALLASTANVALSLNGFDWSTLFTDTGNPATGTIPGSKLAPGSVTGAQVAAGAIGTAQITNGAVGSAQIANGAVGDAQIGVNALDGNVLKVPVNIDGSYSYSLFFSDYGMVDIDNTATAYNNGIFSTYPAYGLRVQGVYPVAAFNPSGTAAYLAEPSYGGYFSGNVYVGGTLSKSAGSFRIDHPLDPANKYLNHSFVESPDMKNLYDGVATLDAHGAVVITLPAWFQALNMEFRYQLTSLGASQPGLYIASEVASNQFSIAGGLPAGRVSWQVTGTRHDVYANAHRIPVEEDKVGDLKGTYLNPVEHSQPAAKSELLARHPAKQEKPAAPKQP